MTEDKMNIFKNIFKRNFYTTDPAKLADDLGPLRGYFHFRGFDHNKNLWLPPSDRQNTLVNQSKSSIIRLISQQTSNWGNHTDPTKYKIAYMRFGNNAKDGASGITKHLYYDLAEPSARENEPYAESGASYAYPGGQQQSIIGGVVPKISAGANSSISKTILKTNAVITDNIAIFTIKDDSNYRPPSFNTLVVQILRNDTVLETLYFTSDTEDVMYTRSTNGIKPTKIVSTDINSFVSTPDPSGLSGTGNITRTITSESDTRTLLYYDYSAKAWKLMLEEWINSNRAEAYQYNKIKVMYTLGKNNVINSIIPKTGVNAGTGTSEILRYSGSMDYYTILSNVEYRDSDSSFIDDYSCSFAVNMGRTEGNGNVGSGDKIHYKEAFLFNAQNEMFSAIYLNTAMSKDADISYYIVWSIVSPL